MNSVLVLWVVCSAVCGQQASFVNYGQGCGGRLGLPANVPKIVASDVPRLGTTIGVTATNMPGNYPRCRNYPQFWLVIGRSRTTMNGLPLPYRLQDGMFFPYTLGGPACDLLCSWEVCHPLGTFQGTAIHIPNNPVLLGAVAYTQVWISVMEWCNAQRDWILLTDGGMMTIGL
jgi:hypothetical protein